MVSIRPERTVQRAVEPVETKPVKAKEKAKAKKAVKPVKSKK